MQIFKVNDNISIVCTSENTRYGFRHLATLLRNGYEIAKAKACYYNRTWERFTYNSVMEQLAEKNPDYREVIQKMLSERTA